MTQIEQISADFFKRSALIRFIRQIRVPIISICFKAVQVLCR